MNLRILKKLSKRAAPYLVRIGDKRTQFTAVDGDNFHGLKIRDITRLERTGSPNAKSVHRDMHFATIAPKCRAGTAHPYVHLSYPSNPIKGTVMVGAMEGYYEPEWDECTAWEALRNWVRGHFWEYDEKTDRAYYTRRFRNPGEIFAAADELLEARKPRPTPSNI